MPDALSLETLTAEDFRPFHGARFTLVGGSSAGDASTVEAELVAVTEYPDGARPGSRVPFSVLFHGPLQPLLSQGMHRIEHARFGTLDLFLVPVGPEEPPGPEQPV